MDNKDLLLLLRINAQVLLCRKYFGLNESCRMDYFHDAFIKVVEKVGNKYEEMGKFDSWVRTVTINFIRSELKHESAEQRNFEIYKANYEASISKSGSLDIKHKYLIELAIDALDTLPDIDCLMVVGRMNGKSCAKLAKELKINIKTVRKHLKKSYAIIREYVKKEYFNHYHEPLDNDVIY